MGSHTLSVAFMKVWFCRHKRADMRTDTDKDAWPYCVLTEKLNLILAYKCGCLIEPLGFCTHICWQSLSSDVATPVHHGGCVVWAWGIFLMKHQRSVVSLEAVTSCIFWFLIYSIFVSACSSWSQMSVDGLKICDQLWLCLEMTVWVLPNHHRSASTKWMLKFDIFSL